MTTPAPTQPTKKNRTWAWIAVALLGGHVLLMATAVTLAVRGHGSAGVTPDYYQQALSWDESRAILKRNETLGWKISVTPSIWLSANQQREVTVEALTRQGQPLTDADVKLSTYHRLAPTETHQAVGNETQPGIYTANLPMVRQGEWRITVRIEHGDDVYEQPFDQPIVPMNASNPKEADAK